MTAPDDTGRVAAWLQAIGLAKYEPLFRDQAIDFELLLELDNDDLKEIKIPLGDRKRILTAIARLKSEPGSLPAPGHRDSFEPGKAERRQITIMFCDLVDSTKLATELDPEDLADLLRAYRNCCSELIARWKGYIAQYYGDGVLVFFGWPHAEEDDAERAVCAGLELTAAVGRLRAGGTSTLAARVGLATGLVIIGELIGEGFAQEETVIGAIPNLAARLQTVAEPGTVVIPASTYQLIRGRFECSPLGRHYLKGFPEDVEVWRVDQLSSTTRFSARLAYRLTPFVGRTREKLLLRELWQKAEQGSGCAAQIVGEAGLGKSRLVRWLEVSLRSSPKVLLHWQCSSLHSNSALHPFIEQFNSSANIGAEDPPGVKLQKAEALLAEEGQDIGEVGPMLAAILGIPLGGPQAAPDLNRQNKQMLDVVTALILGSARDRPLLVMVEDIHWADPTTVDVLKKLIASIRTERVMVLMTSRLGADVYWPPELGVVGIELNRLTRSSAYRMVCQLTGDRALPDKVVEAVVSRADGIPLFIEELTLTVLESGRLREAGDRYELAGSTFGLSIPLTLRDSLAARLDRLSVDKEIAQVAATIGRTFSPRLLSHVLQKSETSFSHTILHLCDAGILEQRGTEAARRYVFRHALIQEVAYRSQLNAQRREVHRRVARAIESYFPEEAKAVPETMARHFAEADLPEIATRYALEAGRKALQLPATSEAIAHLTKGLELIAPLPKSASIDLLALRLHASLGTAFMIAKSWAAPEAEAAYRTASSLIHTATDPAEAIWILWGSWVHHQVRGNMIGASAALDHLRAAADRQDDQNSRLIADMIALQVAFYSGQFDDAIRYCEAVDSGFGAADHRSLTNLYTIDLRLVSAVHRSIANWIQGSSDEAAALAVDAERIARSIDHPYSTAWTLTWGSTVYLLRGDHDALASRLDEGMALARKHGFSYIAAMARFMGGWLQAQRGGLADGIAEMQSGLTDFQATGAGIVVPYFRTLIAESLGKAGRMDEALQLLRQAQDQIERWGERWQLAEVYRVTGEVIAADSDIQCQRVKQAFDRSIAIAESQAAQGWTSRTRAALARFLDRHRKSNDHYAAIQAPQGNCINTVETGR